MILHTVATIAQHRGSGAWGDRTIDDLLTATVAAHPDAIAVVDAPNRATLDGRPPLRLNYRQYDALVDRVAARLLALGVGKDDIVLVQLPNVVELIALIQACARMGAIVSPVPVQYGAHELTRIVATLGGVALAVTGGQWRGQPQAARFAAMLRRIAPTAPVAAFGASLVAGVAAMDEAVDDPGRAVAAHRARHPIDADDVFTICWTSGTVAEPKGVPRSHNNWLWHGAAVVEAGNYRPGEAILSPFPAVNMGGFGSALLPWWLTGGKLVLHHPFDADVYASQLEDEGVGVTLAAPAILTALLKDEAVLAGRDLSRLHDVPCGGAPLSPWLITEFKRRFGIDVINQFGSNEGITLVADPREVPDPEERASFFQRMGVPGLTWRAQFARDLRTRLADPVTGEEITEPGRPGELLFASPSIFPGYFNRPDLTADAFAGEYYRSGDLFEIACDTAGRPRFYRFMGRAKELIIRGGFNIAPPEIEALLLEHPAIAAAAVIGVPCDRLGERVCACVVSRTPALSLAEVLTLFARADMARFKWPERLELFDELPRNPIGKVVKRDLAAAIAARSRRAA